MCVYVCVCVRECVRACVRACVSERLRVRASVRARACFPPHLPGHFELFEAAGQMAFKEARVGGVENDQA